MTDGLVGAIGLALRVLLGLVFLRAGLAKLQNRQHFVSAVLDYRILGPRSSELVGRWLPVAEGVLGGLLLLGLAQTWVATALGGLLVVFGGAVSWNLIHGRAIDCGCGGPGAPKQITWGTVARNMSIAAMAAVLAVRPSNLLSLTSFGRHVVSSSITAGQGVAIAIAVATLVLLERLAREAEGARRSLRQFEAVRNSTRGPR